MMCQYISLDDSNKYPRFIIYLKKFKTFSTGPQKFHYAKIMFMNTCALWELAFATQIIKNNIKSLYWLHNHHTLL